MNNINEKLERIMDENDDESPFASAMSLGTISSSFSKEDDELIEGTARLICFILSILVPIQESEKDKTISILKNLATKFFLKQGIIHRNTKFEPTKTFSNAMKKDDKTPNGMIWLNENENN